MWARDLADADARCGAKAANLARLIAAGLRVPPGFVVEPAAAAGALPADAVAAIEARAAALGVLAVRSSSTLEDTGAWSGAGVLASETGVAPENVWTAIRAVWASAHTPLALRYAERRGTDAVATAVIVQRFVAGARITVYTRPPGSPAGATLWIQRTAPDGEPHMHEHARTDDDGIVRAALQAEAAIGAAATGADVELIDADDGVWIVQARPIIHATAHPSAAPPALVLAPLVADGRAWTWDLAHNPDPLSPAQAGLVERVERAGAAPWAMRVAGGYLYSAPGDVARVAPLRDLADLDARTAAIAARIEAILVDAELPLAEALDRYLAFYRVWARELAPLIATARAGLTEAQLAGARTAAAESVLLAAARGELAEADAIAQLAPLAPAWDVAVPTYGEDPARITEAISRARRVLAAHVPPPPPAAPDPIARAAANLAERDDVWFARAQWLVRRALRAHARIRGFDPEDAPWLPLDELDAIHDADTARRRAAAARAAAARAARWSMPRTIHGAAIAAPPPASRVFQGRGTGGTITGRVVRFGSLAAATGVGPHDVIVTRAVTPALAVAVIGCGALVSETGGLLDHGAALARELGIPCVVGARGAWAALTDGTVVTVDGAAGTVAAT